MADIKGRPGQVMNGGISGEAIPSQNEVSPSSGGGFFSSPEFWSQIASQAQDASSKKKSNKMAQVALATAPFSKMSSQLFDESKAGIGDPFDLVGGTLKSKAARDLRLRENREAKQQELLQKRNVSFDNLRKRRLEAQITALENKTNKG